MAKTKTKKSNKRVKKKKLIKVDFKNVVHENDDPDAVNEEEEPKNNTPAIEATPGAPPEEAPVNEEETMVVPAKQLTDLLQQNKNLKTRFTEERNKNQEMMVDLLTVIGTLQNIEKELNLDMDAGMSARNVKAVWKLIGKFTSDDSNISELIPKEMVDIVEKYKDVWAEIKNSAEPTKEITDGGE